MNEIQEHLEEEKAKLESLQVEKANTANAAPYKQTQLSISIATQTAVVSSLERLIEKLK